MANLVFVKLGPLTKQVSRLAAAQERVANALEIILRQVYGIEPITGDNAQAEAENSSVTYASDESSAIREAEEEAVRLGLRPPEVAE